jgi:hypothetical protein
MRILIFYILYIVPMYCIANPNNPYRKCLELYYSEQYELAIQCVEELYNKTKERGYLRELANFHNKVGEKFHQREQKSMACYHLDLAIQIYRRYLKLPSKSLTKNELEELKTKITNLQAKIGYATLKIESIPKGAAIRLEGYRIKRRSLAPAQFAKLCPGNYQLNARLRGNCAKSTTTLRHTKITPSANGTSAFDQALTAALGLEPDRHRLFGHQQQHVRPAHSALQKFL